MTAVQGEGMGMCVFGMDITASPVPGSVTSYTFYLQPGRSQLLRAMPVFSSFIHAGHEKGSAADVFCLPLPGQKKKEITGEALPRSRAHDFSQQTVASDCKGCASNIQMAECMLMDLVQVARKKGRRGAVFSLFDGEHGRNAVVQCTQVIIEWLDKNGANGANYSNEAAKSVSDCVVGRASGTERRVRG